MVGWHHQLNGHEFEQTLGDGEGQGGLACCSPWGRKESDTTEQLNSKSDLHRFPPEGACLASVYGKHLMNPFLPLTFMLKLLSSLGGNNKKKKENRYPFEQTNKMVCPHHLQRVRLYPVGHLMNNLQY